LTAAGFAALALVVACVTACGDASGAPERNQPGPASAGKATASSAAQAKPVPPAVPLTTDRPRQSPGVIAAGGGDAPYDYGPTVLAEDGRYRMWWCSQLGAAPPPGDDILYAESTALDGPFGVDGGPSRAVLSGSVNGFDGVHTCDPSVVRVAGTYYLYYTGAAGDHAHGNAIGVATSSDGVNWTRANGGNPIVSPSYDTIRDNNTYGAGQPSVVYLDGWFYLMFTDTTGKAAGWNGAGQFVLRSKDPVFGSGVQALGDGGFADVPRTAVPRQRSVVDAFSADWMWIDALSAFAIAHETDQGTTLTFWNRDFTANPYQPVTIPGPWKEGPGLVRGSTGHAPVSAEDPCHRVPVDVVRATVDGSAGAPDGLAHFGLDLRGDGCRTQEEAAAALDGFGVPSPERTVDVLVSGKLLRVERRTVAERIAVRVLDQRPSVLDGLSVVARLTPEVPALRSPDGSVGLVLDDKRLWNLGAAGAEIAGLNSSSVRDLTPVQAGNYTRGPDLAALRR
jgi:hypothetical protein